jgi:NAD(P)-dependent dehydrogenase (short-subunit alcohol dehydrogenase family)
VPAHVYGSAKAGLDGFANGLAGALHDSGVRLLIVRSGFVIGRMTTGMAPTILSSTAGASCDGHRTRVGARSADRLGASRHAGIGDGHSPSPPVPQSPSPPVNMAQNAPLSVQDSPRVWWQMAAARPVGIGKSTRQA